MCPIGSGLTPLLFFFFLNFSHFSRPSTSFPLPSLFPPFPCPHRTFFWLCSCLVGLLSPLADASQGNNLSHIPQFPPGVVTSFPRRFFFCPIAFSQFELLTEKHRGNLRPEYLSSPLSPFPVGVIAGTIPSPLRILLAGKMGPANFPRCHRSREIVCRDRRPPVTTAEIPETFPGLFSEFRPSLSPFTVSFKPFL